MSFDAHANLAISTVKTAPSPALTGTTLTVKTGEGARFPTPPFNVTIGPVGQTLTPDNSEIGRVTAIVGDTFTITRTQEGIGPRAIHAGDLIFESPTAKTFTDIESAISAGASAPDTQVVYGTGAGFTSSANLLNDSGTFKVNEPVWIGTLSPTTTAYHIQGTGSDLLAASNYTEGTITTPLNSMGAYSFGDVNTLGSTFLTVNPSADDPDYNYYTGNTIQVKLPAANNKKVYNLAGEIVNVAVDGTAASQGTDLTAYGMIYSVTNTQPVSAMEGVFGQITVNANTGTVLPIFGGASVLSGTVTNMQLLYASFFAGGGTISNLYGNYFTGVKTGGTITNLFATWSKDLTNVATNPYYFWADGPAVARIRAETNGNSIFAIYNPQFTKYTPGAANYERLIFGDWSNDNIARIGTEKGGTGSTRPLSLTVDGTPYLTVKGTTGQEGWVLNNFNSGEKSLNLQISIENSNVVTPFTPLYVLELIRNTTGATALDITTDGITSTIIVGPEAQAVIGTVQAKTSVIQVLGSGDTQNSHALDFGAIRYDIGTGYTQSTGPAGASWVTDWSVQGAIAVQHSSLNGISLVMNNYYNGSPSFSGGAGMWLQSKPGIGGGLDATHAAATTYPMDVGIGIVGTASGGTGAGFTTAIQIGGSGGPWGVATSKCVYGIDARDFSTAGVFLHNGVAGATPLVIKDNSGGALTSWQDSSANIVVQLSTGGAFQFGGTSSSFPALKRISGAVLGARLADDSNYTAFYSNDLITFDSGQTKYVNIYHDGTNAVVTTDAVTTNMSVLTAADGSLLLGVNAGTGAWVVGYSGFSYSLYPNADAAQDLGLSGLRRVRNGYFSGDVNSATVTTSGNGTISGTLYAHSLTRADASGNRYYKLSNEAVLFYASKVPAGAVWSIGTGVCGKVMAGTP